MRAPSAPPGLKYLNLLLEVTSFTCFKHIQQWICGVKLIFSMNGQHVGDIPITFREFPWFHCKRHPLYLSSITTVLPGYHFTMVLFTYEPMSLFFSIPPWLGNELVGSQAHQPPTQELLPIGPVLI